VAALVTHQHLVFRPLVAGPAVPESVLAATRTRRVTGSAHCGRYSPKKHLQPFPSNKRHFKLLKGTKWGEDPSNDGGDIALERVDGGGVSRAELESGYDVSRLEPVIVAPDFTEEAMADVDNALRNAGNVYAMRDGRVIRCADGWRGGNRSYPNDGLYVYEPPEAAGTGDDSTGETPTETSPEGAESTDGDTASADAGDGEDTTDPDGPRLGVVTGLAGVAGAGYLLQRGSEDDSD
jgi:hypothetical protein